VVKEIPGIAALQKVEIGDAVASSVEHAAKALGYCWQSGHRPRRKSRKVPNSVVLAALRRHPEGLTIHRIAGAFIPARRQAEAISMSIYHCSLV
jgi:hypothetical protein